MTIFIQIVEDYISVRNASPEKTKDDSEELLMFSVASKQYPIEILDALTTVLESTHTKGAVA
jgi:hypothetical protein